MPDSAPRPPATHLLYLHGFRSSPQSAKARQMAERVAREHPDVVWWCPQLPPSPEAAMRQVLDGTRDWPHERMAVVGSSLGGFYARWLHTRLGCRVALLNPAIRPARDLAKHIGEQTTWQNPQERIFFEPGFVAELQALQNHITLPLRDAWALIAMGDEVLDWREMVGGCVGAHIQLLTGGDHALSDFDQHIGELIQFLQLA
ncbi:YqiA/YcfP family alpha/beta fold hydrolase [Hydrogenophaga sp. OTU3427]|uniref:YqiA/YcfP family alpha/beta fold hydrolase n=1 Tax=Hydrogenophaga sp. OTU3427 TaxID=3043856 RepID=UPI00313AFD3D